MEINGKKCNFEKQYAECKIDFAVEELIYRLIKNPRLEEAGKTKIDEQIDTAELDAVLENIKSEQVYKFLSCFEHLYGKFTDLEKKRFLRLFVKQVDIFPCKQSDGRIIKLIEFNFPVYIDKKEVTHCVGTN